MGRLIVIMFATVAVWGSVAYVLVESAAADNFTYLILGLFAFLATVIMWAAGYAMTVTSLREASRGQDHATLDSKSKRSVGNSLTSVVETFSPEKVAALEAALERRRESFDEDDQILVNRLSAEPERGKNH